MQLKAINATKSFRGLNIAVYTDIDMKYSDNLSRRPQSLSMTVCQKKNIAALITKTL